METTNSKAVEVLRVEMSWRWILIKGLVCGITMMLLSLPLAFFNIILWGIVELLCVGCGFAVFVKQRRQRGIYLFSPGCISIEGNEEEMEVATYGSLTSADLRLSQGPVERRINVGKIRIRDGEETLYGVSDFDRVRTYLATYYDTQEEEK